MFAIGTLKGGCCLRILILGDRETEDNDVNDLADRDLVCFCGVIDAAQSLEIEDREDLAHNVRRQQWLASHTLEGRFQHAGDKIRELVALASRNTACLGVTHLEKTVFHEEDVGGATLSCQAFQGPNDAVEVQRAFD